MRARRFGLACATWVVIAPAALSAQAALNAQAAATIEAFAERLAADVAADNVGSIAAAVVVDNQVAWAEAFGWKDRDHRIPATPTTTYRTGSISKSITAVAMMRLVERGLLRLDEPVERYLPDIRRLRGYPAATPLTFRHLATHTGGLSREPDLRDAASGPIDAWEAKILESIPHTAVERRPGERYAYSNIGYGILGLAIARAAGRPFTDLVDSLVFAPLGMATATFVVDPVDRAELATGYENHRDGSIDADQPAREHAGRGYKVPNGGIYATVYDLGNFIASVTGAYRGPFLTDSTRAAIIRVQTPESPLDGYGLGFRVIISEDGSRRVGHGGSVSGYTARIEFDPDARIGVVLLRNYNTGRTDLGDAARHLVGQLRLALAHGR